MSYLKTGTSTDDKQIEEFFDIAISEFQKSPNMPKSDDVKAKNFGIFNPEKIKHDENGYPVFTAAQSEILDFIFKGYLYGYVLGLVNMGVAIALDRFSIGKIQENLHNKELIEYLDKQVEDVYAKHPNYRKCTREQFRKSSMFNYFMSEFRDKRKKDLAKKLFKEFADKAIEYNLMPYLLDKFFSKYGIGVIKPPINPMTGRAGAPGRVIKKGTIKTLKYLFTKPFKILCNRAGYSFGLGSVYEQAIMYRGTILFIGLDFGPAGFQFVNLRVLSIKENGKLVQTQIKDVPMHLMTPSKDSFRDIMRKIFRKSKKDIEKEMREIGKGQ